MLFLLQDVIIRFGGEEFIVILVDCNEDRLKLQQKRYGLLSHNKRFKRSETFSKTLSIGTAMFPNKQHDFWKYIKQCDIALYSAKQVVEIKWFNTDGME